MDTDSPNERRQFLKQAGCVSMVPAALLAAGGHASPVSAEVQSRSGRSTDPPRESAATGSDIGSLFPVIDRLGQRHPFDYSFLGNRFRSFDAFQVQGRAKLLECLGRRPAEVEPRPEIVERREMGDFVREKLLFSTTPDFRIPAYLHIPKAAQQRPLPAIVDLHSHGGMYLFGKEKVVNLGNNHPIMDDYHTHVYGGRATSTELVRRGYVVMTIDAFMFGERRVLMDDDLKHGWDRAKYSRETANYLNGVCRSKESTVVKSLALAGYTWPGIVTWDDMRTVDYLITRPEVDPQRIGCVGVSMGGHRALYLAGLDDRIAAACVVGFMSTVRPMIRAHIDTHSFVHFIPLLHQFLDMPDVVSMMAPKPLLVQQCREDGLYPLSGMQQSLGKIAAVYAKVGAEQQFSGRFFDGRHRFDQAMQNEAFDWFDAQLGE